MVLHLEYELSDQPGRWGGSKRKVKRSHWEGKESKISKGPKMKQRSAREKEERTRLVLTVVTGGRR